MRKSILQKSIIFNLSKCQNKSSWVEEVRGEFASRANQCFFLGVQDVENSKPVFDLDFHTELIIKVEYEDCNLGYMETLLDRA